jgi:hypothetical protein
MVLLKKRVKWWENKEKTLVMRWRAGCRSLIPALIGGEGRGGSGLAGGRGGRRGTGPSRQYCGRTWRGGGVVGGLGAKEPGMADLCL